MNLFKQIRAILLLPVVALFVIPSILLWSGEPGQPGWGLPGVLKWGLIVLGLGFTGLGLIMIVQTVALFITVGQGTLAPWDPPARLVVRGVYRHVRNPMISGVFSVLLGETLIAGSASLAYYLAVFILVNLIYIPLIEEPALERRFGADYRRYVEHVPRWIPRLKAWEEPR